MLNIILYDYYTIVLWVGGREWGKDGSQGGGGGGGAEEIFIKGVGWPKSGGLGKKYFKGGPGQKGVNQILRGGGGAVTLDESVIILQKICLENINEVR